MMMSGTAVLLVWPWVAALGAGLLSRWARATAIFGTAAAAIIWLLLWQAEAPIAPQISWSFLGRSLLYSAGIRATFLFILGGLALLLAWSVVVPQQRPFVTAAFLAIPPLAAALMVQPPLFGAIFLLLGVAALVGVAQGGQAGSVGGALRYLTTFVLALPFFLLAGTLLAAPAGLGAALERMVVLGALLLFAGFPFHVWVTTLVRRAPLASWTAVLGLMQLVVVLFVYGFLAQAPGLQREPQLVRLIQLSGSVTLLVAALLLLTAHRLRRLVGGLLLLDMGLSLLTLLLPEQVGLATAVQLQLARFFTLFLLMVGAQAMLAHGGGEDVRLAGVRLGAANNAGMVRRAPLSTAVFLLGCFALLGLPLTVGFYGRWAILLAVAQLSPGTAVLMTVALAVGGLAILRMTPHLFASTDQPQVETGRTQLALGLLLLVAMVTAVFPAWLLGWATAVAQTIP